MKAATVFRKCIKEQSRDILTLILTLICAAFFVVLYKVMLPDSLFRCRILIFSGAEDSRSEFSYLQSIDSAVKSGEWKGKRPNISISRTETIEEGRRILRNGGADVMLILEQDFLEGLASGSIRNTQLIFEGDPASPQYQMGVVLISTAVEDTLRRLAGDERLTTVEERPLGIAGEMTRFENYVPGLLFVSIIILVFSVSIAVTREVEAKTINRLRLTKIRAIHFLGGYTLAYVLIGVVSIIVTLLTAYALGFNSYGAVVHDLFWAIVVCSLTSLSVIGIGLIVAAMAKSTIQAFLISIFPVLLLLFFSGAFYPIPKIVIVEAGWVQIGIYDILPPTHAISGMKKLLIYGSQPRELAYEFICLVLLSIVYFLTGVAVFKKRHF